MKKLKFSVFVAAVLTVISVGFAVFQKQTPNEESSLLSSSEEIIKTIITDRVQYIMREYNGKLAIFNDDGTVYKTYEINVELLPEYDQKLLKDGIQITGEEELRARVEDYTS